MKYSTTIDRDGREIEALLDWLARSPETLSHVDVDLHEEEPTHEQLVDRLSRAGWQPVVTRYVFPGRRSAVHNGISVRIWIAGAGWLRGEFSAGGQTVSLEASSVLDNGWEDLLEALSDLVSGNTRSEARWWEEPYYAHFRFTKADPDHVRLVIVREDYNEDPREVVERVLLDATVSLRGIAAAVAETSRALLDEYPHAELGDIWRTEAFLPIALLHPRGSSPRAGRRCRTGRIRAARDADALAIQKGSPLKHHGTPSDEASGGQED